ncbi:Uncharacterised protein [Photobacterium damselae]|nr:Uncharacterised protein [Photobacterium damselae]
MVFCQTENGEKLYRWFMTYWEEPVEPKTLNYAQMMHHLVGIDPYKCILCGGRMCFVKMEMGLKGHELVALRKATTREKRRLRYSH